MNQDYLWNRTGEPDAEIQRLEQILGTLRYQPRPLELPAKMPIVHPRTFLPRVAIAAAVAAILVGASWLLVRRQDTSVSSQSASSLSAVKEESPEPEIGATAAKDQVLAESKITNAPGKAEQKHRGKRKSLTAGNRQLRIIRASGPELSARDRAEARAAKEQLLLALRVASTKLSLAQKRAQATYPASPIRNHHKVG